MSGQISDHYQQQLRTPLILQRLRHHYPQGPATHQLAPIDQLHIGGLAASQQLINRLIDLNVKQVLDIGSGTGGLMRLAQKVEGLEIVGLDLCQEFNLLNRELSALCPQTAIPTLVTADAQQLPFKSQSFDLVLFQHSLLNIPNDGAVLAECHRLLKPNGYLLLHEVLCGASPETMRFPVPWARDAANSHLLNESQLRQLITASGFALNALTDWSEQALEWRQRQISKEQSQPSKPAVVSPTLILGEEFHLMGGNIVANLKSNAVRVIELLAQRI